MSTIASKKAKTEVKCNVCGKWIRAGENYILQSGRNLEIMRMCNECWKKRLDKEGGGMKEGGNE